jgi:assimilatory nitrate reductase catalytic subunit
MTRTGRVARLMKHTPAAFLAMNPADARAMKIRADDPVEIATAHGRMILPVALEPGQRPGEIFLAMHWTEDFSAAGPAARLVWSERDPYSKQPDLKGTLAQITPLLAHWHGVMLTLEEAPAPAVGLWSRIPLATGWITQLTGLDPLGDDPAALLPRPADAETILISDAVEGVFRVAALREGQLIGFLAVAPERAALPPTDWLAEMLGRPVPGAARLSLCGDPSPEGGAGGGAMLCACHQVTVTAVRRAITSGRLTNTDAVGQATGAGTKCRSCLPEIAELLRDLHEHA